MKPGIKPTHMWHYFSQKAFKAIINERISMKRAELETFSNKIINTNLLAGSMVLALLYSFGMFSPTEIVMKYIQENSCEPMDKHIPPPNKPEPFDPCVKKK